MSAVGSPDYSGHEVVYQHLLASGAKGWSGDEEYATMEALVTPWLVDGSAAAGVRVLELGSGAGNFSARLAQRGHRVHGVDISSTAVAWANDRARESNLTCTFSCDDVCVLGSCEDASFDVVVDGHCLHCIIGEDRKRCLEAVGRVLVPQGRLVVLTMCGEVRNPRLLAAWDPQARVAFHGGRPVRYIGQAEAIVHEIERSGFEIEHWHVDERQNDNEQDDLVLVARRMY